MRGPQLLKQSLVLAVALMLQGAAAQDMVAASLLQSKRDGGDVRGDVRPEEYEFVDINGAVHRPLKEEAVKAVVLVFIVPDCPICKAYMPELNRLQADYGRRGVRLFLLHTDPELTKEDAQQHARAYQLRLPVVLDSRHAWVSKVGATITPEAAVLSSAGKLLYRGRIDNRFPRIGQRRTHVTSHDLRDALDAILASKPIAQPRTEAVGCHIDLDNES
jgi:thiol-disulfide isomerase/thioredoxin